MAKSVTLHVRRQDGADQPARVASYTIAAEPADSVWDCLYRIARDVDPSLGLRDNCFAGVCGECGCRIDDRDVLGCTIRLRDLGADIAVAPLRHHRVLRDLIVDRAAHFDRLAAAGAGFVPGPARDTVDDSAMLVPRQVAACQHCGLCLSACESFVRDPATPFVGPAALAWTARFLADPRDGNAGERRALAASNAGVSGCVECGACDPACPAEVAPLARIGALR